MADTAISMTPQSPAERFRATFQPELGELEIQSATSLSGMLLRVEGVRHRECQMVEYRSPMNGETREFVSAGMLRSTAHRSQVMLCRTDIMSGFMPHFPTENRERFQQRHRSTGWSTSRAPTNREPV